MEIRQYNSGILSSNMYVLTENQHAVVIDPARDTAPGEGLILDLLLITHEHYDHISGVNAWKERYHAPLLCSETCAGRIGDPRKNQARHFDVFCKILSHLPTDTLQTIDTAYTCTAEKTFSDQTAFDWQGHSFLLMEIPGHSPGSIGILLDGVHFFSGDSLLKDMSVEFRFPGGSKKQWLEQSESRIRSLPKGITVWPGHFESFIM